MSWEDMLQSILGGAAAPRSDRSPGQASEVDPLADLLGGILGGVSPHQAAGSQGRAGGLPDLLGGILGGADGKLDLGDIAGILGGILGGAAPAGGTQSTPGGLGDIMGGILGGAGSIGGSQPSPGGLGAGTLGGNSFLTPIITELAQRLGLPPAMASAVVSLVLGKLLSASAQSAGKAPAPEQPGLDLDHLLETIGTGQQLQPSYLQSTGLVDELSERTGIDKGTALESLQQVLAMLGGQLAAGPAPRGQAAATDLDHLLDTWQD